MESTASPQRKKLFVSHEDKSVRMFKSNFMDFFSRVHFTIPLILYVPVILAFGYISFFGGALSLLQAGLVWIAGLVFWTFTEYILHRFVFHYHPTSKIGKRIHFIAHGVHHDYPNDSMRLVLPPSISVPLAFLFYFLFRLLLGEAFHAPFYGGFVLGYLLYDELHYATHHAKFKGRWFQNLKMYHMKHHYQDPDMGFGVSNNIWDVIFGTRFKQDSKSK
jgi:dihydroceramide fatty acyl 2-hydroxylase